MHRSVPKIVHDQNLICKPFNIKLPSDNGIMNSLIIILENLISVHKPILDSGKCSLSRISTLTSIVTKQKFIYIMSRNGAQGPSLAFYTLER